MKPLTLVLGLVAAALIALGLTLGFRTVYDERGFDCGSAFRENPDLRSAQYFDTMVGGDGQTGCDKERSDAQPFPLTLLVLGGLSGAAAVAVGVTARRDRRNVPLARG